MDVEVVWLGAVGLPEETVRGIPQLRDRTARFAAGDGPGGESGNIAEVGGNGDFGDCEGRGVSCMLVRLLIVPIYMGRSMLMT